GGVVTLLIVVFVISSVVSQFQKKPTASNGTQTNVPAASPAEDQLLAFTSEKDGNLDIYTMHADGSGLTNITNNPVYDTSPFWSPNGKRIAFESGRDGSWGQIYLMNADGSNVVQLTHDQADHQFIRNYGANSSPWSPDGSRLIISQKIPGGERWTLYTMNINGENKTPLVSEPNIYNAISWSPDGRHIAFIADNPQSLDGDRLYVVNEDGSNLREVTESLLPDKQLFNFDYYWADDGQSIFFVAFSRKAEPYWTAYEARLDDNSLIERATTNTALYHWQNNISVVGEFSIESPIKWSRSDETNSTLHPYEHCMQKDGLLFGSHMKRSSNGNWAINAYCPNGDFWFYYANSDGTMIKQLLNSPLTAKDSDLIDILWSPDDKFIIFEMASPDKTDLYILNVSEALTDPSIQPLQVAIGDGSYGPDWQPVVHNDIVEEEPTQTDNRLLAFTSNQDGNLDIYTMHSDGSALTNLTNNPAQDVSPVWSPDGKRIAFESDRNGFRQIFLMNMDGSNVVQLTDDKKDDTNNQADQWIGEPYQLSRNLWSPDGNKLIFLQTVPGEEDLMLYIIDTNGENKKPLVNKAGKYSSPSWSPDGKHIAFIALENNVSRLYSTDSNGNNLTEVTKRLPAEETLYPVIYSWSRDGQSVSFIASNWNYLLGGGGANSPTYEWRAHEASLDGNTLITNVSTRSHIGGYWDGTYFLSGSAAISSSPAFTWVRSDGGVASVNPIKNCQQLLDSNTGGYTSGYSSYKQSSNGNVVIGGYCPNGDKWLFWADSKGTSRQLLNSPIQVQSAPSNAMHLWAPPDFIWSSDDKYIAFNIFTLGKTDMYIVNVADSLKDPSIQPFQMTIGNGSLYYSPTWQPIP
ncbi:MAG: DPP IV N-terminal domain-containing protein, partial [Anaerolineales bacterium]